ncbi:hypothetical protein COV53_04425 [Candidatus Gottesmanbacteria bacterium CG11_big_fil_rev_8_21_14_0_20_37_11]|uniref:Uncharacterized protein n=3 Tax=Microgenomates group TaxID=1794810 RepID=A0A1J4TMZ3_9BACT|nr:MAG: hypothetical protein AUJ73_05225 [Candidatus Gottesmanbacteria bacterium CG1_02_37_22]PIR08163.1 MAG: hypothetical protein COV53_04425 [Candidatus Gottesmanbacteria bacterium CG11_big_fil_rev_8_21_14_0_20_37_11]
MRDQTIIGEPCEDEPKTIAIDDIPDIAIPSTASLKTQKYLSYIGVVPTSSLRDNFISKLLGAGIITSFAAIYATNALLYSICILMSVLNLLTNLIVDRNTENRAKIGTFVADWLLMGIIAVVAQMTIGNVIQIPFTQISAPIVLLVLAYFVISYIWQITNRLLPYSTITKSSTLNNLVHALHRGGKTFTDDFEKRQTNNLGKKNS